MAVAQPQRQPVHGLVKIILIAVDDQHAIDQLRALAVQDSLTDRIVDLGMGEQRILFPRAGTLPTN